MRLRNAAPAPLAAAALVFPATADAHVDVLPVEVEAAAPQAFTIRVPSEREVPTGSVRVDFPPQVAVASFGVTSGWRTRPLRAPGGRLRGVVYSDGAIGAGRYAEFEVLGTPSEEGTAVWRGAQTYADGVVKRWSGPPEEAGVAPTETGPDAPGPAAATRVRAPGTLTASPTDGAGFPTGIVLASIAMVISVGAIALTVHLWRSGPEPGR